MRKNLIKTRPHPQKVPRLRFSPTAWAKLLHLRDLGPTEIGAFAITEPKKPLLVNDVALVRQMSSALTVSFDDAAVADFFDGQVDLGRRPEQFARIWLHTHPGDCARPSRTDEETFARVFGLTDWAVMFILARGGQVYCRLQFHVGPGGRLELPVELDLANPFCATNFDAWTQEYLATVRELEESPSVASHSLLPSPNWRNHDEFDAF